MIEGVDRLGGADYTFAEDFHEIATFLALGAITGGEVSVRNAQPEQFPLIDRAFAKFGVEISHADGWSTAARRRARCGCARPSPPTSCPRSRPRPGPICRSICCRSSSRSGACAEGEMLFWNKVYEGALGWTSELAKFGGHALQCDPHRVITFGGKTAGAGEGREPLHHPRRHRAADGRRQHRGPVDHPQRRPDPPGPPAVRREPDRASAPMWSGPEEPAQRSEMPPSMTSSAAVT